MAETGTTVRLADVGAQLARQWKVVAAVTVIVAIAACAFGLLKPRSYSTNAVLTVAALPSNPLSSSGKSDTPNMATERAVMQSTEVATRAKQLLKSPQGPRDLVDHITVSSPTQSQVLDVTATGTTPDASARIANAFAHGYLDVRGAHATANLQRIESGLDKRIKALTAQLGQDSNGTSADAARAELHDLQSEKSTLTTAPVDPGRVVTEADATTAQPSLSVLIYLAGGVVAGLLLGVGAGLLRERFGRNVGSGARLSTFIDVPVVEQDSPEYTAEYLDRIAVRAGLENADPLATVAVIGMETPEATGLGVALWERLGRTGFRPVVAPDTGESSPAELTNPSRWQGKADVVLITTSLADGLARAVLLAHNADRAILVVTRDAELSRVTGIVPEFAAVGAHLDVVAAVPVRRSDARQSVRPADWRTRTPPSPAPAPSPMEAPTKRMPPVPEPVSRRPGTR